MSPLAGGNSEDEGKPCCENAIAHETDRKSEPACWRAATGSLMNSYSMEASKILRSTVLTSLASQTLSVRVWLARLEVLTSLKIHKPRDIHMTSDARLLCLQSDWFRQHSGANAVHLLLPLPLSLRAPPTCARKYVWPARLIARKECILLSE